ncbi:capsule assembly Wzi family protein [Pigmentiphaga daeguensis]|uniref:capsule assembly Wzi family protein n=1 Tax=Pigmentiphaga daeguensis TaxID=414049 RepID=UPI0031D279E9
MREDVQWLVDRGVIDVSTSSWPMPLAALETAVVERRSTNLSRADEAALDGVTKFISRQKRTTIGVKAQINTDRMPPLGFAGQSLGTATGSAYIATSAERLAVKLQANGVVDPITKYQSSFNMQGSYAAANIFGQILYVGQLSHWWGPGQDGSLAWSNAATAVPGIGLRRGTDTPFETPWLSWIGSWGYEAFIGQQQHSRAIPDTRVANMRLYVRPLDGLELGASRMIQWGGKGRANGLGALWDALTSNSNVDTPGQDFSNELAGFDVRYTTRLLWGNPLTFYVQGIGEDEAGTLPSRFLALGGVEFKHMVGNTRMQWHVEAADTNASRVFGLGDGRSGYAYSHGLYRDGYYQDGLPIGHAIGGSGYMYSTGVSVIPDDPRYHKRYSARVLYAEVNPTSQTINQAFPEKDRFYGGELSVSWIMAPITFRAGAMLLRSVKGTANDSFGVFFSTDIPLYIF